ncbi:serine hydrolase [Luteimonas sp. SJ-92]|uniref:Serine hydrolase n=1 Tax=Luteimonas salinisoli TaxID=2752307 RepID=A0A853JBH1_9GAMM|nr:serine hydrolase [Luteimonas salinisoli]NZA26561.1 serine hydrolase [Luteimonas salinisoli]
MKKLKTALVAIAAVVVLCGLAMFYPLVPGTKAPPAQPHSVFEEDLTRALRDFAEARESIDAVVIASSKEVLFVHGAAHLPINTHSVRKSVMSVLIGMAVLEGKLEVTDSLAKLGIDDEAMPLTDLEKTATVADLLKARSGIYIEAAGETEDMKAGRPRRGQYRPGAHYYYNNWDFNALGTVLAASTGAAPEQHMRRLAGRLGFQDYEAGHFYYQTARDSEHDQYTIFMSARDLARVGQMMLRQGRDPAGGSLVSAEWVADSTRPYSRLVDRDPLDGYGYLWSLDADTGTYWATGWGGQFMLVDPRNDLVIVARNDTGRRLGQLGWLVLLDKSSQGSLADMEALRAMATRR